MRRALQSFVLVSCASLTVAGCRHSPNGELPPIPNPVERIRYTPPPEFYTERCNEASDRVAHAFGSMGVEFDRGDGYDFIAALQSRLSECRTDRRFVLDYLDLLEIEGWSGTYNRVLADFEEQFPGQRYPDPLPDSSVVGAGNR